MNDYADGKDLELFFANLQQNCPEIFALKLEGWSLWAIIKPALFTRLFGGIIVKNQTFFQYFNKKKRPLLAKAREFALGYFEWKQLTKTFGKKRHCPVIMAFGSSLSRYKCEDDRYKHAYFDYIYASANRTFDMFIIEQTSGRKRARNTVGPRHLRGEYVTFSGSIGARFFQVTTDAQAKIKKLSEIIVNSLEKYPEMQAMIRNEFNSGFVEQCVYSFFDVKTRAKTIIKNINPSAILVTSTPGYYGFIAAAKEMNVPVIEIQHGDVSSYYPAYCWPQWTRDIKDQLPIPDKIFMFGKYWTDLQIKTGFWKESEVLPFGNCRIDEFRREFKKQERNIKKHDITKPVKLLFTTQLVRDEALSFLKKFLQIAKDKRMPLKLYVKVHPGEENEMEVYKVLQTEYPQRCVVYNPTEVSLYELMSKVDIHFSIYSTSLYESITIGTPTMVLDMAGKNYVYHLLETGAARLCSAPEELIRYVYEVKNNTTWWQKWLGDAKRAGSFFYARNAAESFVNYLNEMLSGNHCECKRALN